MADRDPKNTLQSCLKLLKNDTAHPEKFLSLQNGLASDFTALTKTLYDLHKAHKPEGIAGSPLEQLVVENFDEEQIWQELELQNKAVLRRLKAAVNQAVTDETIGLQEEEEEEEEEETGNNNKVDDEQEEMSGEDVEDEEDEKESKPSKSSDEAAEKFTDEDSDVDFDVDELEKRTKQQKLTKLKIQRQAGPESEVDDRFFKLSEMEAFLEEMEKREGKDDGGDSEVEYFQDLPSGEDDELDLEEEQMSKREKKIKSQTSSRNLKYKDFFDPVEGGLAQRDPEEDEDLGSEEDGGSEAGMQDEDDKEDEGDEGDLDEDDMEDAEDAEEDEKSLQAKGASKKVTFDLSDDSEGEDMEDIIGGKRAEIPEIKSSFEKREEKIAEKIQQLEKAALGEKPWQLMGEVTGQTRPENSLLAEDVQFDQSSRTAPAVTEETTLALEDIIKQRVRDQAWDDVARKEKPKDEVFEYKKRLTLDHEKSKLSLAEVYEQEYLKQTQQKTEVEEKPAHVEIQKLMDSLFLKLDALSNFHFTPKPPVPEVKVVSNLPSITMEEVAPVSASSGALLAPEEIKEKNRGGDILGDTEKTATDKKRERRKKKVAKRSKLQEKARRQKLREANNVGEKKKATKAEVAENLKKVTKGGRAAVLKDEGKNKALRSSQAFFTQLQDQVKSQIKGAKDQSAKKKKQKEVSAIKLKL